MTNEVGNLIYKLASTHLKDCLKKMKVNEEATAFTLEAFSEAKIYNFSDVYDRYLRKLRISLEKPAEANKFYDDLCGCEFVGHDFPNKCSMGVKGAELPDFPVLTYFITDNGNNALAKSVIPLGEDRYLIFSSAIDLKRRAVVSGYVMRAETVGNYEGLDIEIAGEANVNLCEQMKAEGVKVGEPLENYINNYKHPQIVLRILSEVSMIASTFTALTKQDKRLYKCYSDEPQTTRGVAYINVPNKPVIRVNEKPVFLILRDDEYLNNNIKRYRRKGGNIQYCFSWIVRGHWRKLHNPETMGYGMVGERVQGKTYIKSFIKGDKSAPLIKRTVEVLDRRTHG